MFNIDFFRYSIAVSLGHVPALLPYISDSGVLIPERSIFSQLINLAVIVQLITFYIRLSESHGYSKYLSQSYVFQGCHLAFLDLATLTFSKERVFRKGGGGAYPEYGKAKFLCK
jgi:hypothetical protein